jgi:hypothetical protein
MGREQVFVYTLIYGKIPLRDYYKSTYTHAAQLYCFLFFFIIHSILEINKKLFIGYTCMVHLEHTCKTRFDNTIFPTRKYEHSVTLLLTSLLYCSCLFVIHFCDTCDLFGWKKTVQVFNPC